MSCSYPWTACGATASEPTRTNSGHSAIPTCAPATPVLDDLANSGAFFTNVIASAPYTSAAHATVFTGQYPARHGLHAFYEGFLRSPSVFTHARRAGRQTLMKVDFPVILGDQLGFTADIDTYLVEEDQKFIDAVLATETSLSLAHFAGMHMPYGFHNLRFGGSAYQEKIAWMESLLPEEVPHQVDELNETYRTPADMALFLRYKRAVNYLYAAGKYDTLFQMYLDGIEFFLKSRFEPFLTQLVDRVRQAGKTLLLVLFGDHGQQFEDDSYGNFNSLEEGVLRIPLIIAGDGVAQGRHLRRIRSADIAPTVMELAGIDVPWRGLFDGESRATWFGDGPRSPRTHRHWPRRTPPTRGNSCITRNASAPARTQGRCRTYFWARALTWTAPGWSG